MYLTRKEENLHYEFLPAALEISETPPSPFGRIVIWLIFLILVVAILWSCMGKIDEVASARGKIIPDGRLKVVQPLEEGIVTAIYVNEGQRVKKGQSLIELDSTMKKVDVEGLEKAIGTTMFESELLKKINTNKDSKEARVKSELSEEEKMNLLNLNQAKEAEYKVKREALKLIILQSESELKLSQAEVQKLEKNLLILKEKEQIFKDLLNTEGIEESNLKKIASNVEMLKSQEKMYKELYDKGAISKKDWEDRSNQYILAEKEYETQKAKAREEKNSLKLDWKNVSDEIILNQQELQSQRIRVEQNKVKLEQAKKNLENLDKENKASLLNELVEKDKKTSELNTELTKAKKSMQFQSLVSPVNGTVHGLVSNTIGGVVTPAQAIMTIVPDGTPLVVEASIQNKDIGFVSVGQEVAVKFDTFPFQKYGTVKGKVISISPDAFEDEKTGSSVYKMKVALERKTINVDGKEVHISPGMAVTAEIKTGKRRIIEFFLEPLIKYAEESLKVR